MTDKYTYMHCMNMAVGDIGSCTKLRLDDSSDITDWDMDDFGAIHGPTWPRSR